ncbi:hypothetical protein EGR_00002 [Echinococcus granulosus]|uniref:Uncharacterized protein n=1 Tax=Echinococcus granulosus TaxID=6210 RepID=W6UTW5_ECHGR|nr:hypothetical protein EGR_00002 [Echinococcus granulosus]EUB64733.1 hypothetical protein EGR_00002 [Echinococcus granulosus]
MPVSRLHFPIFCLNAISFSFLPLTSYSLEDCAILPLVGHLSKQFSNNFRAKYFKNTSSMPNNYVLLCPLNLFAVVFYLTFVVQQSIQLCSPNFHACRNLKYDNQRSTGIKIGINCQKSLEISRICNNIDLKSKPGVEEVWNYDSELLFKEMIRDFVGGRENEGGHLIPLSIEFHISARGQSDDWANEAGYFCTDLVPMHFNLSACFCLISALSCQACDWKNLLQNMLATFHHHYIPLHLITITTKFLRL